MSAAVLVERNLMIYKHTWYVLLAEIFEPILYLLSIGVGIGVLVGTVTDVPGGDPVSYASYVAPALLATAAMNGAMNETTFAMFGKLRTDRTFESMLATPLTERDVALGEIGWAVLRGTVVSFAFLAVITALGLVHSPWALLVVPGAALIAFAFATAGVVVVTFLRDWQDMQYIQLVMLPMFLFATTFYPLSVYPGRSRSWSSACRSTSRSSCSAIPPSASSPRRSWSPRSTWPPWARSAWSSRSADSPAPWPADRDRSASAHRHPRFRYARSAPAVPKTWWSQSESAPRRTGNGGPAARLAWCGGRVRMAIRGAVRPEGAGRRAGVAAEGIRRA